MKNASNSKRKGDTKSPTCRCGAAEGELHDWGCPNELCPFCEGILTSCDCMYDMLMLRGRAHPPRNNWLSDRVYSKGITDAEEARWRKLVDSRGRIPYLYAPLLCARCGEQWPEFFVIPDLAWEYYAGPNFRDHMLCEPCFWTIQRAVDAHQERPAWVPSLKEIEAYLAAWCRDDSDRMKAIDPVKFEPFSPKTRPCVLGGRARRS